VKRTNNYKKYEDISNSLECEFAGDLNNTESLTSLDRKILHEIIDEDTPKIPITIRFAEWQIKRAKQIAKKRKIKGYQTLIRQIVSKALINENYI